MDEPVRAQVFIWSVWSRSTGKFIDFYTNEDDIPDEYMRENFSDYYVKSDSFSVVLERPIFVRIG